MITLEHIKEFDSQQDGKAGSWVKQHAPNYYSLDAKNKGKYGEKFFNSYCENLQGVNITWNDNNDDHDFVVNGLKIELKFSFASWVKGAAHYDKFTFNHIAKHKDWDYLVLIGINPPESIAHLRKGHKYEETVRAYAISKHDFLENYDYNIENNLLSVQQGGKASGNDDHMVTDYQKILNWKGIKRLNEII